ncbi:protein archease isoform X3 [Leucoraja erinacea]|uniref:protein archease isoform X3 n=1 Tax=Leucoraja erinaceus TaxID=7782 RepID=UPI002458351A|nr:protein archease isoform X3 [Leucoraja erinacea]
MEGGSVGGTSAQPGRHGRQGVQPDGRAARRQTQVPARHQEIWITLLMFRHDMLSLLYNFMAEWLYQFSAELFFIPREMKVIHLDRSNYTIRSIGWGEEFDIAKHPQGTEVKAITYSAMQIHEDESPHIFVIIDI